MKVHEYIVRFLAQKGVQTIFEVSGGMITFLLDSLNQHGAMRVISVHHEQAAAFAVDGFGRMSDFPAAAMATSGPGAINLLTGIGSCFFDSIPGVFITGQVNRHEQKKGRAIRQLGFQETDIVTMAKPITKYAVQIDDPDEVPATMERAFALAISGRPGPVLIDIPMDVQRCSIEAAFPLSRTAPNKKTAALTPYLKRLFQALKASNRPLLLVGGGVRSSRATDAIIDLVAAIGAPVVHSLMGVDILPSDHPLRVGMIGSYGNRWANHAVNDSDLLLVLGSRLDVRQTGADTESFKGDRKIFHVDCEEGELNGRVTGCDTLLVDLNEFAEHANVESAEHELPIWAEWGLHVEQLRKAYPDTSELKGIEGINPNSLMHAISVVFTDAAAYVADVGQHQMWAAQSLDLGENQRFLTSGGMGSMGFALPAAIGAALAAEGLPIVVIAGDGGFQCNIQEIQTVVRNKLPIKIIILNNRCHGMVRQFQETYFNGRYQSTLWGYSAPDFAAIGEGYGLPSRTIEDSEAIKDALSWLHATSGAALLQIMIDTFANAYPKLAFGLPISEMEPIAKPIAMEST